MKNIKKALTIIFAVVIICTMFTACSGNTTDTTTPLTYVRTSDELYTSNVIETEEGVTIQCTSNYVIGPEANGQFLFMLKEWSEECLDEAYDWSLDFESNGYIYQADFYDSQDNLIVNQKCDDKVTVNQDYEDTYVAKVVLYIEHEDNLYTAELIRSGM